MADARSHAPVSSRDAVARGLLDLCSWASALPVEAIPESVLRRALLILCDDIAAIVAARHEPEVAALQNRLLARSGPAEATIFRGGQVRADRVTAAVANGAAADWCELDEGYRRAACHGGLYTIPALVADAEASGATTLATVRALVVGYEVVARFARTFPQRAMVLHPHASLAAVGAAAAVAALRGLQPDVFAGAVASASTMVAPGPYGHAVQGALVRNVWPAAGAWCGLQAVEWAECGIAGMPDSPWHVFAAPFGSEPQPEELTLGLGRDWAVADGYHKVHACCQYSHSAVEATLAALGGETLRSDDVASISIETHRLGLTLDNRCPATTLAAKFSLPHIVAAACLLGHAGAEAFAAPTLADRNFAALRERIAFSLFEPEHAWPADRPARVDIVLVDGTRRSAECLSARGGPDRPWSHDELMAKMRAIVDPVYPAMSGVFAELLAADPSALGRPWAMHVQAMVASDRR